MLYAWRFAKAPNLVESDVCKIYKHLSFIFTQWSKYSSWRHCGGGQSVRSGGRAALIQSLTSYDAVRWSNHLRKLFWFNVLAICPLHTPTLANWKSSLLPLSMSWSWYVMQKKGPYSSGESWHFRGVLEGSLRVYKPKHLRASCDGLCDFAVCLRLIMYCGNSSLKMWYGQDITLPVRLIPSNTGLYFPCSDQMGKAITGWWTSITWEKTPREIWWMPHFKLKIRIMKIFWKSSNNAWTRESSNQ